MELDARRHRPALMRPLIGLTAALLLLGAGLVAPVARVAACSCMEMTPQQAFDSADVVFIGMALQVETVPGGDEFGMDALVYRFAVDEPRKGLGLLDREAALVTATNDAACGASLELGARYLVHGHWSDQRISTSSCSGNKMLDAGAAPVTPVPGAADEPADSFEGALLAGLVALALLAVVAGSGYLFLRR